MRLGSAARRRPPGGPAARRVSRLAAGALRLALLFPAAAMACPTALQDFGANGADLPACAPFAPGARLIPNFETMSVEVDAARAPGGPGAKALMRLREAGGGAWRPALDAAFDARAWSAAEHGAPEDLPPMWRGALVGLRPGVAYEVEVLVLGGPGGPLRLCGAASTRDDAFPVAAEIRLPDVTGAPWAEAVRIAAGPDGAVVATRGADGAELGRAAAGGPQGYVLVTGGRVEGGRDGVVLDAPFVILRGLAIAGAAENGVRLGPRARDVVVEDNEISGFGDRDGEPGDSDGEGFARNWRAGIFAEARPMGGLPAAPAERLTIQDNRIHGPRWDANAWRDWRPGVAGAGRSCAPGPDGARPGRAWFCHPEGAHGLVLRGAPRGQNVIRRNRFWSTPDRMFNDVMAGQAAIDAGGFPGPNSDIHDNVLSHFQDDGIEADNGGRNVRIWGNRVIATPDDDEPLGAWKRSAGDAGRADTLSGVAAISAAPVALGPLYAWRNTLLRAETAETAGVAIKQQGWPVYRGGAQVWAHNVLARDPDAPGARPWAVGIRATPRGEADERLENLLFANNAVDAANHAVQRPADPSVSAGPVAVRSNTVNGPLMEGGAFAAVHPDGNRGAPRRGMAFAFAPDGSLDAGPPELRATLIDRAEILPGLSDCWGGGYAGAGPDIGAVEARP
jgi:hypothetical protein